MVCCCAAVGCAIRSSQGVSMHRFPADQERRRVWIAKVRRENWEPSRDSRLCDLHFDSSQYESHRADGVRKLKQNAIPTLFKYLSVEKRESLQNLRPPPKKRSRNALVDEKKLTVMSDSDENDIIHGDVDNSEHQSKQSYPISESQAVPHIVLDPPNTNTSDSFENKNVFDNVLRMQKPFLDSEVMMLVEEYLQLCEVFQNLEEMARINVDLLYVGIDVNKFPDIKVEVDKVKELIQTLMGRRKVCTIEIFHVEKNERAGDAVNLDNQQNASGKEDVDAIKGCDIEHSVSDDDDYHEDNEASLPFDGNKDVNADDKLHVETSDKERNESPLPTKISCVPQHHACHLCDQTFTNRRQFSIHLKTEHNDAVHKCEICSQEFKGYQAFSHHRRLHDKGDFGELCSICGQLFKSRNTLISHLKLHEEIKNGPYKCTVCCKELKSQKVLKIHMKAHVKSKLSGVVYDSALRLGLHRKCVNPEESKDCPICGKKITSNNLKRHIRIHRGDKPYKCYICHKTFTQTSNLQVHIRTHTRKYPHQCSYCNKGFNLPSSLRFHEHRHLGIKPYRCGKCDKVFLSQTLANAHEAQHDSCKEAVVRDKRLHCTVCPRQFVRSATFALHMLLHIDCKELDHCLLCEDGKSFTSLIEFESHVKSVHLSEKPFKCSVCEESFFTFSSLYQHRAMHTGALTCKECGKSFTSYTGLNCHLKTKHNPEHLKFTCDICGKQLSSVAILNRHRKIHTGLKPCKCTICGHSLSSRAALKLHLWTHKKEKIFQCEKCEKGFNDKRHYISHLEKCKPESSAIPC